MLYPELFRQLEAVRGNMESDIPWDKITHINYAFAAVDEQSHTIKVDDSATKMTWDGVMDNGKKASPGTYSMKVEASMNGQMQALESLVRARVDSVSLGRNGLPPTLNVNGIGAVDMADVLEIL